MGYRIQNRRDTAARWAEMNPILLEGEMGIVLDDPNQYKIGDGVHTWNELPLRGFTGTIAQTLGNNENAVASQKVVTEKFAEQDEKLSDIGSEVVKIQSIKRNDRFYITKGGNVGYNEGLDFALSDYFVVSENVVINKCKPTGNAPYLVGCLYDEDMNYIGDVTSDKNSVHNISLSDIEVPTNAKYMRANLLVGEGNVQGASFDYISSLFDVIGSRPTKKEFSNLTSKVDENVFGVYVERFKYIGIYDGLPTIRETNSTDFSVTPYLRIKELSDFSITCKPSSDLSFAGLYDSNFNPIAYIIHTGTSNVNYSLDMLKNEIANQNLTDTAVFVVFCVAYSKTNEGKLQISKRADVGLSKKVGELEEGLKKAEEEIKSNLYGIEVNRYSYIRSIDGLPKMYSTTASEFSTTNYLKIKELNDFSIVCKPYGASPYTFAGLYDKDFNPIGCINFTGTNNVGGYTLSKLTNDIELQGFSENAYYVIFNIAYSYTNNGFINIAKKAEVKKTDDWWSNKDIYNYEKVLSIPKDVVKAMVETASNGRCTAIYDNDGYPSLMYKIPIISVGALEKKLGDFNTPHPAFIVNGEQKKHIYISVFMSSSYNGHLVSWFGLSPVASLNITQLRNLSQGKGEGWHIETIYERSLLSLLARKFNSPNPKCNNYWGRSRNNEDAYLCAEMVNGGLPGKGLQSNGAKWINGSQPSEWSHNKELWGIQDVCGGYHEIVDCVKVVDGFIYLCSDNGYNASEETWINTGIAYDYIGGELALNTRITSRTPSESTYVKKDIEDVILTSEYDLLSEDLRKKMVMLFISPKLKSNEEGLTLGTNGDVGVNNNIGVTGYMVMGGAEEYANCGYNYNVNSYDLSVITAHNNMGSRIVYIEP